MLTNNGTAGLTMVQIHIAIAAVSCTGYLSYMLVKYSQLFASLSISFLSLVKKQIVRPEL